MSISCYVIGGNSLLMACTDVLVERDHDVRGIITSSPTVRQWAHENGLPVIDADGDYTARLRQDSFDFLFSIANLEMIPNDALALPRRFAVNFHDGLLPEYAGLNVPAWALINGQSRHGVTWHVMTRRADAGDILKQHAFDVGETDTALTLNAKCFDAGMTTFSALVDELDDGSETRRKQDLTRRQYFSRTDRPAAACFLDWNQDAAQLDALVRATDFGDYPNPLGVAKLMTGRDAYVVRESSFDEANFASASGTISNTANDWIEVCSGKGTLAVHQLTELDGQPISIHDFLSRSGLKLGDRLEVMPETRRHEFTERDRFVAQSEPFWTDRLARFQPVDWFQESPDPLSERTLSTVPIPIPTPFLQRFGDSFDDAVVAALSVYLAVLTQQNRIDLAFEESIDDSIQHKYDVWESRRVPISVAIDMGRGFDAAVEQVRHERKRTASHGPWSRDLVGRIPELRSKPELKGARLDAVGVHLVQHLSEQPIADDWLSPALRVSLADHECELTFARQRYLPDGIDSFANRFGVFLERLAEGHPIPLSRICALTRDEEWQIVEVWNRTSRDYPSDQCIHQLFEQQVERTPDALAVAFSDETLSYAELNARANQVAARLREMGVVPDQLIGVCVERSIEMVVAILGIQKAGGAYVPLDPSFPKNRIAVMLEDTRAPIIISQSHLVPTLPPTDAAVVQIDADWDSIATMPRDNVTSTVGPSNLAYVIHTSGSTGRPKGVMVEHRNVVNFFAGMDDCVAMDPAQENVLLAVTSLSFDISVLELLWTLTRGFKVVLYSERIRPRVTLGSEAETTPMQFGLFYFSSDEGERSDDKYQLLIEGAKFADQNGFVSVSTPERHFHAFGGLYPNPAVTSAAIASITQRVQIRAGSVVTPLHHPIRIAEDWALVDNLSHGRVGISFASGWQPVDFVLRPECYIDRHQRMYDGIETVRKLWRGEHVQFPDMNGEARSIRTLPRPIQEELPVWVTTAGSKETWISAGKIGANVLTHLLGQTVAEIADKIRAYRLAYEEAGHAGRGCITLMLHTFVGDDNDHVRETVRQPLTDYLASSVSLVKSVASSWTAYKRTADGTAANVPDNLSDLSQEDMEDLLAYSFERYYSTSGLFGTPDHCAAFVRQLRGVGVDEIACLIDFGIDSETVLRHLEHLNQLRILCEHDMSASVPEPVPASGNQTIGALIRHHHVTHLQCTPSMASMILADEEAKESLSGLRRLLIGGEAFPANLARELRADTDATIVNMYGPTETTIWSSTHTIQSDETSIPIGRPIANTQLYVLNEHMQPVPAGWIGELYIGGDGVVRGYHGQPEMTAERFVENPFYQIQRDGGGRPSERLYRTGDLARYRSDGTLEFLGRVDHQVKVLGYRIELGEIELALTDHPEIRESVVIAREDSSGDKRLVAYYVGDPNQPIEDAELRDFLRERLPPYMIPSHFISLPSVPLTPNRKIDRKALPAPEHSHRQRDESELAPLSNDFEKQIADIWQEVLGVARAGRDDNFFEIGGHSLLAVKALRILRDTFDREIAITDLFRFPTVSALAAHLSDDSESSHMTESQQRGASRRELLARRRSHRTE